MITEEEVKEVLKDYPGIRICVGFTDIKKGTRSLSVFLTSDVFFGCENRIADFYYNAKLNNVLNGSRTLYSIPIFTGDCVCLNADHKIRKTIKTKEDILKYVMNLVEKLKPYKVKMKLKDMEQDFV